MWCITCITGEPSTPHFPFTRGGDSKCLFCVTVTNLTVSYQERRIACRWANCLDRSTTFLTTQQLMDHIMDTHTSHVSLCPYIGMSHYIGTQSNDSPRTQVAKGGCLSVIWVIIVGRDTKGRDSALRHFRRSRQSAFRIPFEMSLPHMNLVPRLKLPRARRSSCIGPVRRRCYMMYCRVEGRVLMSIV